MPERHPRPAETQEQSKSPLSGTIPLVRHASNPDPLSGRNEMPQLGALPGCWQREKVERDVGLLSPR